MILDLLANAIPTDGVGGRHYQSNKVAVLGESDNNAYFAFHFYQIIPESRRLYSRMECSNAATASALTAMILGVVRPDSDGLLKSVNLATNQSIELMPPRTWWNGEWGVRFTNLRHLWSHIIQSVEKVQFRHGDLTVNGDIFWHGNVFVMANVPVGGISPQLVAELTQRGQDFATKGGHEWR
jgi:hypothetical protein